MLNRKMVLAYFPLSRGTQVAVNTESGRFSLAYPRKATENRPNVARWIRSRQWSPSRLAYVFCSFTSMITCWRELCKDNHEITWQPLLTQFLIAVNNVGVYPTKERFLACPTTDEVHFYSLFCGSIKRSLFVFLESDWNRCDEYYLGSIGKCISIVSGVSFSPSVRFPSTRTS